MSATVPYSVVRYCALECERQRSGERSVLWMLDGWLYARRRRNRPPTMTDVLALGRIVEPRHNLKGLRQVGVLVGGDLKMPWENVLPSLAALVAEHLPWGPDYESDAVAQSLYTDVDEWFREYEEIHPFRDGNGRTGSLLWNWLRGTLLEPADPPDFWSGIAKWTLPSLPSDGLGGAA